MITRLSGFLRKVATLPLDRPCPGASFAACTVVSALKRSFDQVRRSELERRLSRESLSPEEAERLERFSQALVERLLKDPGLRLPRLAAAGADPGELTEALAILGLADGPAPGHPTGPLGVERSA